MHRSRLVFAAACAALVGPWSETALASGFDVPAVGSTRSGAVTRDAAAIFHNPGQLGYMARGEVMFGAALVVGKAGYRRERLASYQQEDALQFKVPIDGAYADPSKTGPARSVSSTPLAPTAEVFAAIPMPTRVPLVLGLGVYTPYAAALDFPEDGPQRWQLRDVLLTASNVSAGLAIVPHAKVSIGASVSYVLGFLELSKVQDFAALDEFGAALERDPSNQDNDFGVDAPSAVRELEVLSRPVWIKDAWSHGATFNVGFAVRPTRRFDLGIVYQHGSRMRYRGDFTLDMDDDFFTQDLAANGIQYEPVVDGSARIGFWLPIRATLAAGYDVSDRVRLELMGQYVAYSLVRDFDIRFRSPGLAQPDLGLGNTTRALLPRDWMDVAVVEASARIRPHEAVVVSATLGYHSPVSPDETVDVASLDGHRLLGAAGVGWLIRQKVELLVDGELQGILPRQVSESTNDLGNGTYRLLLSSIGLHLRAFFGAGKATGAGGN